MAKRFSKGLAALFLGLMLSACDRAETILSTSEAGPVAAPEGATPVTREILALKARENDPARFQDQVEEILARHGYPVPASADPVAREEIDPAAAGGPLGKTAAVYSWNEVKSFDFTFNFAFLTTVTVPANRTLTAWTTAAAPV